MKRAYVLTVAVAAGMVPLFARATTQNSAPPVEARSAEPPSAGPQGPEENFDAKAEVQTLPEQTYGRRGYYEGYVASFGTFRLSFTGSRGMFLASEGSSGRYFFQDAPLRYLGWHRDWCTGITGHLFRAHLDDGTRRYFLFGDCDLPNCCSSVTQRYMIVYGVPCWGRAVHRVNFGRSLFRAGPAEAAQRPDLQKELH
jgi:hypothetical protein